MVSIIDYRIVSADMKRYLTSDNGLNERGGSGDRSSCGDGKCDVKIGCRMRCERS